MPQLASDQLGEEPVVSRPIDTCLGDRWTVLGAKPRVNLLRSLATAEYELNLVYTHLNE